MSEVNMIADVGIGDIVRKAEGSSHGKYYKIIAFGEDVVSGKKKVVYQALHPPFGTWIMPYEVFMGRTSKGTYQFEVMTTTDLAKIAAEERLKGGRNGDGISVGVRHILG